MFTFKKPAKTFREAALRSRVLLAIVAFIVVVTLLDFCSVLYKTYISAHLGIR